MFYTYDPVLVIVSIVVAIVGAYSCFDLVFKIRKRQLAGRQWMLIGAAFAIGGSIWSMHFIAMLAINLPVEIRYDFLTTFVSGLVSVLMTAVALLIVLPNDFQVRRILAAGALMGLGIASMHYVGMSAIRGNCIVNYSPFWIAVSVVVAMGASCTSLWAAMTLHGVWKRIVAALVMGVSISGMHYSSMLGTTFFSLDNALEFSRPILSPFSLGLATAVATFVILGWAVLTLIPEVVIAHSPEPDAGLPDETPKEENVVTAAVATEGEITREQEVIEQSPVMNKLPVQKNNKTYFVDFSDVIHVAADGHYTTIWTNDQQELFCNYALSRVQKELDTTQFVQVHRSHFVNLAYVESFERQQDKGQLFLQGSEVSVPVSRSKIGMLEAVLGL